MSYSIGIIGASGYTGAELLRLIAHHPEFVVSCVSAHSQAGMKVGELYPHLASAYPSLTFKQLEEGKDEISRCDIAFCALPHGEAMKVVPQLSSKTIIDLGSDFRLKDKELYDQWYGRAHECPEELDNWCYGLPEFFKEEILTTDLIANPGCFPTAVSLALGPLAKEGLIEDDIVVNAVSGTSGAGRPPSPGLHFSHHQGDFRAYKVAKHQHTPEIEFVLKKYSGKAYTVNFTTHLLPAVRGIHATSVASLAAGKTVNDVLDAYKAVYSDSVFVDVVETPPGIKEVVGSNRTVICPMVDGRTGKVTVLSVIDNLVKGASGQAIQNANIKLELDEATGLTAVGLYP